MKNNNTVVTGIPERLIKSGNVPHPADHIELFEMSGDKYVYVGPDDFKETVKVIQVTDGKIYASDPCYLDNEKLRVEVDNVRNGIWTIDYSGPNLRVINNEYKLARFHAGEVDNTYSDFMEWDTVLDGLVYVDTGIAGFATNPDADIFDKEADTHEYRFTLRGDGGYPVLVKWHDGEVVALEINYEAGAIFNYHHGIVTNEDQNKMIAAVENNDWETYNEVIEKYNVDGRRSPIFPLCMVIGKGWLPINEETFCLAECCEWENG